MPDTTRTPGAVALEYLEWDANGMTPVVGPCTAHKALADLRALLSRVAVLEKALKSVLDYAPHHAEAIVQSAAYAAVLNRARTAPAPREVKP